MDSIRGPIQIIIDTDPGQDDAIAILSAFGASDRLQILALTAVAGNVPVELTSRNARIIRDWAGHTETPVYAGCSRPLARTLITAEEVHGDSGLHGVELPEPRAGLASGTAVNFLGERLSAAAPHSVTVCCLGPLTNVASAFIQAPGIKSAIKQIVWMGGGHFQHGNVTPRAEFNAFVDPHAAELLFQSGVPITVLPLDVTHQVLATRERINRFANLGNKAGKLVADILRSYGRHDLKRFGLDGSPLHDPCVIGFLLAQDLFRGKQVNVSVETCSQLTFGETVVDWYAVTDRKPNALWINQVDAEGLFELLVSKIRNLP
jgi:purine nucleosidase